METKKSHGLHAVLLEQTYGFYGPIQKGFYGHHMTLLIGANHIMRVKAYDAIDGYTAHIAEDMLTGMKLYAHAGGWKSVYVPEALLIDEGPATWDAYLVQQMRWAFGCMDILFRHAPALFIQMNPRKVINYLLLQQFYFSGIAQAVGVGLMMMYFFFGINSAAMALGSSILLFYGIVVLYQTFFQMWLQRFNVLPATEHGLLLRGKVLGIAAWPIYFLAFVSVVFKLHLTYKVTPKGSSQTVSYVPTLFIPHLILGSITLVGVLWGMYTGRTAGPIIFWALLNTGFMYYFFFSQAIPAFWLNLKEVVVLQRSKLSKVPLS
jgi:cellulose synthase (UDP-forming)